MFKNLISGSLSGSVCTCLTLGFDSGHDLIVCEFEPHIGLCADSCGACLGLSITLSAPPQLTLYLAHSLTHSLNQSTLKNNLNSITTAFVKGC